MGEVKRRQFLIATGALLAAPLAAEAQQGRKLPHVGVLHPGSSKEAAWVQREPFERGLRELSWEPGSNIRIDYRYAEGNARRLAELAVELVRSGVDVIVARGNAGVNAARQATTTIPIVMSASDDPIAQGFVQSLSRPGGNITGIAVLVFDLDGKRLELLKEAFPTIHRVAVLTNPDSEPRHHRERIAAVHASARSQKLEVEVFEVRRAEEITAAFENINRARFDALLVRADPLFIDHYRREIATMAAKYRLPAVYWWRFFVEAGGLMSYGESIPGFHHRSATYVSRILRGAKPGELAVERPTKFELVVNLKTAKALGIEMPKALLFRADEVIE